VVTVDPELLVLLLRHYGSVSKFDISQDPLESADAQASSSTNDGYYLFQPVVEEVRPLLESVLRVLHARDPERHARILESAYQDIITDVEEEALRWRGARLAEKGIPGFEEASEIYRYLSDEEFFTHVSSVLLPETPSSSGPVMYPVRWLPKDSFIRSVLREIADDPEVDRIRCELATITNKAIIADGRDIGDPETLKEALGKVAGLLTIALSHLAGNDVREAAAWMSRTWIHFLFRLGYSQIHTLAERARLIRPRASFRWIDQTLYLTGSPLEEALRGLLWPHPLFFEGQNHTNFLGYREFSSMDDVTITEGQLTSIEFLAAYFDRYLSLPPETIKTRCLEGGMGDRLDHIKWSNVLATVWAHSLIHNAYIFQPLTSEEVHQCIRTVFSTTKTGKKKMIHASKIKTFLKWLEEPIPKDRRGGGDVLRNLFLKARQTIEEELRDLDPTQPVDPRFLQSLCISLAH
jgi:hypothetical protein